MLNEKVRVILYLPTKTIPNKKSRPKTGSAFIRSPGYIPPTFSKRRLSTLPLLRSTIDVVGLNFSVRNGKRWIPNAITTLIPFIANSKIFDRTTASRNETKTSKELTPSDVLTKYQTRTIRKSRAISTTRLRHYCPYTCSLSTS